MSGVQGVDTFDFDAFGIRVAAVPEMFSADFPEDPPRPMVVVNDRALSPIEALEVAAAINRAAVETLTGAPFGGEAA